MTMKRLALVMAIAAAAPLAACGGGGTKGSEAMTGVDFPEWVMRGGGAFGGDKQVFYAVGSASKPMSFDLQRTTAGNRARAEMSKTFETYSASLMKDYQSQVTDGEATAQESLVENAVKTFSAATLNGVQIVEYWQNPKDGTVFALARLDLDSFTEKLDNYNKLSDRVKERVRRAAERSFADLEREEAKRSAESE